MDPRRIAASAAVVGAVAWLTKVGMIWANGGANTDEGLVGVMYLIGLLGVVVALGASGYTLVETAPVWLRAIVVVATPVLVLMVWTLLDQAIKAVYTEEGWLRDEVNIVLAAVLALGLGVWALTRGRSEDPARPVGGHRAAR